MKDMEKKKKDSNILIAEFMRLDYESNPREFEIQRCLNNGLIKKPFIDSLKYDASWNWLMPVIEEIEKLNCRVDIFSTACQLEDFRDFGITEGFPKIWDKIIGGTKIEATYLAVIKFIKWYNENKED